MVTGDAGVFGIFLAACQESGGHLHCWLAGRLACRSEGRLFWALMGRLGLLVW